MESIALVFFKLMRTKHLSNIKCYRFLSAEKATLWFNIRTAYDVKEVARSQVYVMYFSKYMCVLFMLNYGINSISLLAATGDWETVSAFYQVHRKYMTINHNFCSMDSIYIKNDCNFSFYFATFTKRNSFKAISDHLIRYFFFLSSMVSHFYSV